MPEQLISTKNPPVGFYFLVTFLKPDTPINFFDIRFERVSGMSSEIETMEIKEGGENLFTHRLPNRVTYNNLVLERGMITSFSPLNLEFNVVMTTMKCTPSNVLILVLNEKQQKLNPIAGWIFKKAYPIKWSISDLDANKSEVIIETMELAYTRFQRFNNLEFM